MNGSLTWQPLTLDDLPSVVRIANTVHSSLPERAEVFADKIRHAPNTCFKLVHRSAVVGYGLAHPWTLRSIPPLDAFLQRLPAAPDCLYIHDIALLPEARGQGASESLLALMSRAAQAAGIPQQACVSVYGTSVYWRRFGFQTVNELSLTAKLAEYGPSACYMVRVLP